MYKTKNETTTIVGQSTATVLAHSVSEGGTELVTWELVYPRYIHCEFLTHRQFSRNASSSRATPTKTLIEEAQNHPVYFDEVRENQRGMVGGELLSIEKEWQVRNLWFQAASQCAGIAQKMADLGVAKQTVNRVLEPFLPIRVIATATDIDNFFKLRLAPDAQPEIRSLAIAMRDSLRKAPAAESFVHMPYADAFEDEAEDRKVIRCIAACARVSIARGNGKATTFEDDLELVKRLLSGGHMTPFEHIANAIDGRFANLSDWQSIRWRIENKRPFPLGLLSEVFNGKE